MSITPNELNTIQACRYCPMCRHSCPSEFINYKESDTPRGRAILLSNVYKAGRPFEASTVESVYNCFLCGACKSWCAGHEIGGYDIPELIKFARRDIVGQGLEPRAVQNMRDALLAHDNTRGLDRNRSFTATATETQAEVLYVLGEGVNYQYPEIAGAFTSILKMSAVNYTVLKDEPTSGKELDLLGYDQDARTKALIMAERIRATGCTTVVVSDPLVYDAFKNDYSRWGIQFSVEVLHVSQYLLRLIQAQKLSLRQVPARVTLADSEFLGRSNNLYDIPRMVIQSFPDVQFAEMQWHHEHMQSAGEAAFTFDGKAFERGKDLGEKISVKAEAIGAEIIVVLSTAAKEHISATTSVKVLDIVEFVYENIDKGSL